MTSYVYFFVACSKELKYFIVMKWMGLFNPSRLETEIMSSDGSTPLIYSFFDKQAIDFTPVGKKFHSCIFCSYRKTALSQNWLKAVFNSEMYFYEMIS